MVIDFLRHAPTEGNMQGRYIGRTDLPLCPQGVALAQRAYWPNDVQRVYTSGMLRSVQTAEILYPAAGMVHLPGLSEMNFGDFEGRSWQEMQADAAYRQWLDTNCEGPCFGGEDMAQFTSRCCGAFLQLVQAEQKAGSGRVYVVAHGGTIMSVLSALARPQRPYFSWKSRFCGGYRLAMEGGPWPARPMLVMQAIDGFDA